MIPRIACALGLLTLAGTTLLVVRATGNDDVFTDPEKAGADYQVQGEYVTDEGGERWGAQVIALGDGRFRVVGHQGGLPGDGWQRGGHREFGEGRRYDDQVRLEGGEWSATIEDGRMTIYDPDGNQVGRLSKVERTSPTLGAEPPEGARVLFDGTTAEHFENGRMTDEGQLMVGAWSKQKFGDHQLHLEFRTPFMPQARGQARGNSGVYVQSRYEIQVLDSFGLEGNNDECGGVYSIAAPRVNMCLPPLAWQTYDIDFRAARYDDEGNKTENARLTVRHNGVVIHDNLELPHGTPGRHPEGPGPESLYLQDHGDPVVFRNIWVVER